MTVPPQIAITEHNRQEELLGTSVRLRVIWKLSSQLVKELKNNEKEHGLSLSAEVKIVREEAVPDYEEARKRIHTLRNKLKRSGKTFSDSADLIREDRDR